MNTDGSEIFVCTDAKYMHKFTVVYAQSLEYVKRWATDFGPLTAENVTHGQYCVL